MSTLGETLLTALLVSGLAACCLLLLPATPPRVRLAVAAAGLAAWIAPWGSIRVVLPAPSAAAPSLVEPLGTTAALAPALPPWLDLGFVFGAALAIGVLLFIGDCVALLRHERRWRANSRGGDHLRALLPVELARVPAEIRIVERSAVAAASGFVKPTIWIGDRYSGALLELTLVHEMWHVRARDPLWLALIAVVRRAYWWNPLVGHLARQAVLMIESTCDHRSAANVDKQSYIRELALLLLTGTARTPRLIATAHSASLDVQRLRLLDTALRLRVRDVALLAALGAAGAATAAAAIVERAAPLRAFAAASLETPIDALPATPAGRVLATLLRASNGGDTELLNEMLGAYTPQELPLPLPRDSGEARIVDILHSEPLRIEYLVENPASGRQYVGSIAVGGSTPARITESRIARTASATREP